MPSEKRAVVLGITGQVGSYLAEFLIAKGYQVHGIVRRASTINTSRIDHLYADPHQHPAKLRLHYGDVLDIDSIRRVLTLVAPEEVYNLAAQSHVRVSFDEPIYTSEATGLGALNVFQAVKEVDKSIRIYQASSSELFGSSPAPQNEQTPFHPRSPYACAKAFAFYAAQNYREAYGMHISNGICFNIESPRRGETFVTRKITRAVGRILVAMHGVVIPKLYLGNLFPKRDWGYAPDYVEAMWKMVQMQDPDDYVLGTGKTRSVGWFVEKAFEAINLNWSSYVTFDSSYNRPTEVDELRADASKAYDKLGWKPKTTVEQLVQLMVDHDTKLAVNEANR